MDRIIWLAISVLVFVFVLSGCSESKNAVAVSGSQKAYATAEGDIPSDAQEIPVNSTVVRIWLCGDGSASGTYIFDDEGCGRRGSRYDLQDTIKERFRDYEVVKILQTKSSGFPSHELFFVYLEKSKG